MSNKNISLMVVILLFFSSNLNSQYSTEDIANKIIPSIVTIFTYDELGNNIGQGTGFFIDKDKIVTNRHVIEDCSKVKVKMSDGEYFIANGIIADDEEWDLAILNVNLPTISTIIPLTLNTKLPTIGEDIIVIGSPQGLELTVSNGIISSIRSIEGYGNYLQITAPISHGSSGSPIINKYGEVIGIVRSSNEEGQNLNFAIPSLRIDVLTYYSIKSFNLIKKPIDEKALEVLEYNSSILNTAMINLGWDPKNITDYQFENILKTMSAVIPDFHEYYRINDIQAQAIIREAIGENKKKTESYSPSNTWGTLNPPTTYSPPPTYYPPIKTYTNNINERLEEIYPLIKFVGCLRIGLDIHSETKDNVFSNYLSSTKSSNIGASISLELALRLLRYFDLGIGLQSFFPRKLFIVEESLSNYYNSELDVPKVFLTSSYLLIRVNIINTYKGKKNHNQSDPDYAAFYLLGRYGVNQLFEIYNSDQTLYSINKWNSFSNPNDHKHYGGGLGFGGDWDGIGYDMEFSYLIYEETLSVNNSVYFAQSTHSVSDKVYSLFRSKAPTSKCQFSNVIKISLAA